MEKFKLYSFKIKKWKEEIRGVLIEEGEDWILLRQLFTDYMIDGFQLINKRYILSTERTDNEIFIEDVLRANKKINFLSLDIPLDDIPLDGKLIFNFFKKHNKIFQLSINKEDVSYIGYINEILPKSIYLSPINAKANWLSYDLLFRMDFIRTMEFNTDYINSLITYNAACKSKEESKQV